MDDERLRRTRLLLAVGVAAGLSYAVLTPLFKPAQVGIASSVYYHAAAAALAGENVYAVAPPATPGYHFLYPPVVVLAFLPHALAGSEAAAFGIQTALNLAAGAGTAVVLWRALDRRGVPVTRLDFGLLAAFVLLSTYGVPQVVMGQTTLWLGFALAVGLDALDRGREAVAGAAFAAAALVKLFPAALGLWLLRRRAWRAVAVATATGLGGLLAGALVFGPDLTVHYVEEVLLARFESEAFAGATDPSRNLATARRQLVAAFGLGSTATTAAAFAVLAPVVVALYRRVDTDRRRQAAVLGTLLATLLFLPLQPLYFPLLVYPLVVLLYTVPAGRARTLLVAGTLFTYALVDLSTVRIVAGAVPGAGAALVGAAEAAFGVVLPATVGMWLLLAGCLAVQFGRGSSGTP